MTKHKSIRQRQQERAALAAAAAQRAIRNKEICQLRREGMALEDIASRFGITRERVRQIIEEYNAITDEANKVPRMFVRRFPSKAEERKAKVKALLLQGKKPPEIAAELGISGALMVSTLTLLRKEGFEVPKREGFGKINLTVAKRMRAAGATLQTIAARFDVTIPSVQQLLDKHAD